jgi:hypothetical protein
MGSLILRSFLVSVAALVASHLIEGAPLQSSLGIAAAVFIIWAFGEWVTHTRPGQTFLRVVLKWPRR